MMRRLWNATTEPRLFLGYAFVVLRPGALPPQHPQTPPLEIPPPPSWTDEDYLLYIEEARRNFDDQQRGKEDIRARAQQVFTTTLVLGGAMAAAYSHHPDHGTGTKISYFVAAVLTLLAGLASAGLITAQSPIGAPNIHNLPRTPSGEVARSLAAEYAQSRHVGAATVAVLVTVLRDCVLVLVIAFIAFAAAYVTDSGSEGRHPQAPPPASSPSTPGSPSVSVSP